MENVFGLRIIFGKFGVGKGMTNSIIAIQEMRDIDIYEACLAEIEELEILKNRTFSKPPQEHVVFSNYNIHDEELKAYDFDPDTFMLPNDEEYFNIYPPYACFHVEEGHSGNFLSYDWSKFPKPALLAFSRLRHPRYIFTIDLQFVSNLNKNLRKFAFEYITPLNYEHKYNCLNMLVETIVSVGVFYSYDKAIEFEETQNVELVQELREYKFNGDIYSCYDSFSKKLEFFDVDIDKDFCYDIQKIKTIPKSKKVEIIL